MRGLIQRVRQAQVRVNAEVCGEIGAGLLLLLGIEAKDDQTSADKLLQKILSYRVFADADDKMNLSLQDVNGGLLVVSQFTLVAQTNKGLRPSFSSAAKPQQAQALYDYFVMQAQHLHSRVSTGQFAADMQVQLTNDGPVTFLLEV